MLIVKVLAVVLTTFLAASGDNNVTPSWYPSAVDDRILEIRIQAVLQGASGEYGVAIESLRDGRTAQIDAGRPFASASLYKLLAAYRVYREVEAGRLSMEDEITITEDDTGSQLMGDDLQPGHTLTVADALYAMITWSSNSAAYALIRNSGGWEGVLESAGELGIAVDSRDEQFWVRPADYLLFFEKLALGSMLNRPDSDELISLLLRQEINDRLPAQLPSGTQVAHKTGELDDIRNDAGIVFGPHGGYIIVVMGNGVTPDEANEIESQISKLVYEQYGQ